MALRLAIGTSDFRKVREAGAYYVDKTALIRDLLDAPAEVVLLPRPRRFGKTMNLSMLRAYLERSPEDVAPLFQGLAISAAGEAYQHHRQRYPVIHLTLKGAKASSFDDCRKALGHALAAELERHAPLLLAGEGLLPSERRRYESLMSGDADPADLWDALALLSRLLHRQTGERAVILVDEYDIPLQAGLAHGYLDQVIELVRNVLTGGLKDNPHLFKGVLTGVLRVARESIFSGLNNVRAYSVVDPEFATAFGFTEPEVTRLCTDLGRPDLLADMRRWYDGYHFGDHSIYNPWSVLSFAERPEQGFQPYWVHTSSEDVLRDLVLERGYPVLGDLEALLRGDAVVRQVSEHVSLRDLAASPHALWSLLLFSGYVTARRTWLEEGRRFAELVIPNVELRYVFEESIASWLAGDAAGADRLDRMLGAMLRGETAEFAAQFAQVALRALSHHDTGGRAPEAVYQAFLLGMLVRLMRSHEVTSNREAGLGRYDILGAPRMPGQPGVVIEIKVAANAEEASVRQALAEALAQIAEKGYAEALRERGAQPIVAYGIACCGKRVWVQREGDAAVYGAVNWPADGAG